jgi:hypothetical protein
MRSHPFVRVALTVALASAAVGTAAKSRAEPTVNGGIGLTDCGKLIADLKPDEGLNHLPNALLFYWVQGYVSAANIYLLNEYTNHIDVSQVDDKKILNLVVEFCKANPGDKPISAIDKFIRTTKKIKVKEDDAFDPWEQ